MSTIERAGAILGSRRDASASHITVGNPTVVPLEPAAPMGSFSGPSPAPRRTLTIDLERNPALLLGAADARTQLAEEFRLVKRSLLYRCRDEAAGTGRDRVIMVTSSRASEGKTFSAVNLALSLAAERDLKVLLIDGDVLRPKAMTSLGVSAEIGLLDVLEDPALDPCDVIFDTNIEGLSLMTAGKPRALSTEMLASARMGWLVERLTKADPTRIVIFDSPPILSATEPLALAAHAGHIVFVVEAFRSTQADIRSSLRYFEDRDDIYLLLNKAAPRPDRQYGYYYRTMRSGRD